LRSVPRWTAVLAVLAVGAVVCAFRLHLPTRARLLAAVPQENLPADGFTAIRLSIHSSDGRDLRGVQVESENPRQLAMESLTTNSNSAVAELRAGVLPGQALVRITAPGFAPTELTLKTDPDNNDSMGDGTPDFLRLHDPADRLAFRQWFTLLAEAQFYREKPQSEIDDCAALLRFAYREALRDHDSEWTKAMASPVPSTAGEIKQYHYPFTPLGAEIFRVRGGSFSANDLRDGAFAQFANAETLWRDNTYLVGHSLTRARPGDLLFFRQEGADMPFHAMIYIGRSQIEPGTQQYVVYHTGPDGDSQGIIKRLSLAELMDFPDPRWRPQASNPTFLGVYRWNILRGDQ